MVHMETKKNVSLGTGDGLKEVLRPSPLQGMGSQRSGKRFGLQIRKPNSQGISSGCGGKSHRGKVGQGTKVGQDSLGEVNRLNGTSNNGHFATSTKDDIWVIVMVH